MHNSNMIKTKPYITTFCPLVKFWGSDITYIVWLQMAWAKTTKVGCAKYRCDVLQNSGTGWNDADYFVCNYAPAWVHDDVTALTLTETDMSSFWWYFHHWLHWKLSFDNFKYSQWWKIRQKDNISFQCFSALQAFVKGILWVSFVMSPKTC